MIQCHWLHLRQTRPRSKVYMFRKAWHAIFHLEVYVFFIHDRVFHLPAAVFFASALAAMADAASSSAMSACMSRCTSHSRVLSMTLLSMGPPSSTSGRLCVSSPLRWSVHRSWL
ncbi:hypothetical protein Micbo1qcDRAFT_167250 [Microdochium bolleyi]|uniref:Uncharacterized protein n=1 Tax=Microdochium bolleyi TaxID=196109 RepID=A0A136IS43_9PEZI|nr:hypothetical protein Micbo1qcDRAFT_167250 [Microdochium bolleyi]